MLPLFPQKILTYNLRVEGVTAMVSASAHVESQSLVLAYGGPDLFFVRTAPSKGFDLLPDDFNKALLAFVVLALVIVVGTLERMSRQKLLKATWA